MVGAKRKARTQARKSVGPPTLASSAPQTRPWVGPGGIVCPFCQRASDALTGESRDTVTPSAQSVISARHASVG